MEETDRFKIFVDQLRNGHVEKLDEKFDSSFLDVNDPELTFKGPVDLSGEAYIAGQELVLHFSIKLNAVIPCVVCNTPVQLNVSLPNCYEAIPLEEIPHGVFNMKETLRQAILLEIKPFAECNNGKCPQRIEIQQYLKKDIPDHPASPFDSLRSDDYEVKGE